MKICIVVLTVLLITVVVEFFSYAPNPTVQGVLLVMAGWAGQSAAPLGIGCLGLLYKRDRQGGFAAASTIALGLMYLGRIV